MSLSNADDAEYASHRRPTASPAVVAARAVLRHLGSAGDLTALDPPSQVNNTAPYTYHRRNSSYSSGTSADAANEASEEPQKEEEVATPSPLPSRNGSRSPRAASPRSLTTSAYSNVSWLSAATPSNLCAVSGAAEATPAPPPPPLPQRSDALLSTPDVHNDEVASTVVIASTVANTYPSSSRAPLTTASESVSALEAQLAASVQQMEVLQRMNRKLESHNAYLETELTKLTTYVAQMHKVHSVSVRRSLDHLKAECASLSAFVHLAAREYRFGLQQTGKAIVQLLASGTPHATAATLASLPPSLTALSRASLRSASGTGGSVTGPYRPGEWLTGISMYAKSVPAYLIEESRGDSTTDELVGEGDELWPQRVQRGEPIEWLPHEAASGVVETTTTGSVDSTERESSPRARLPRWSEAILPQRSPRRQGHAAPAGVGDVEAVQGATLRTGCSTGSECCSDVNSTEGGVAPEVVSLRDYRRLQQQYADCQRQLLLSEGKNRVLRQDADVRVAQLQEAHMARVGTLEAHIRQLRAQLAQNGSLSSPPTQKSTSVVVMRAPDHCYQYSNSSAAWKAHDGVTEVDEEEEENSQRDTEGDREAGAVTSYVSSIDESNRAPMPFRASRTATLSAVPVRLRARGGTPPAESRALAAATAAAQPEGLNESCLSEASSERDIRRAEKKETERQCHDHHGGSQPVVGRDEGSLVEDSFGELDARVASRVAQGLWAEQLLARRRRAKQRYTS